MNFLKRETNRISGRLNRFLSVDACQTLRDGRLLQDGFLPENIYSGFREQALTFFKTRHIMRIPALSDRCSGFCRTRIPGSVGQSSERSDARGQGIKECPTGVKIMGCFSCARSPG